RVGLRERGRLLGRERVATRGRVVDHVARRRLRVEPLAAGTLGALAALGQLLRRERPALERAPEAEPVADHHQRGAHRSADVADHLAEELFQLRHVERVRHRVTSMPTSLGADRLSQRWRRRGNERHSSPMPQIRLLGELEVVRDGRPVPLPASKKTRALLGYLAVEPRGTLRERLCELLWEGPDDPRAQLRWSLSKLRPLLAGVELRADRERVELCAGEGDVDLRAVEGAVGREIGSAPLDSLRAAAARFRGELLDGLDLPGCYRYQAWLEGGREAARALRVEILQALCERLSGEPEQALEHARAWVAAEPLAESAHAQVVRHLGALGRRQEAMRQIDACRELLARELGAEPSGPLERARHELNARPRATAVEVAAPSRARPVEASAPGGGAQLPFVGRAAELRTIEALIAAAAAGRLGELLLVTGDAGVGKTRLFAELTARVAAAGGRVLAGRAFEAEMVRPYGAWIDALRALPTAAVDAGLRADLAPLRPDLGAAHADADRGRLFTAVARLLAKEAERAPLVVVLDDLHWIDESSAALLSSVARAELGGRVILAAGARAGELSDNAAALKLIRALGRDRRLRTVELGPLEREDI